MPLPASFLPANDSFAGRTILVTGAGQGLGRVAALALAAHGATVVLHGRKVPKLEAVYDEIEAAGGATPAIVPLDYTLAGEAEFRGAAEAIFAACKRLDGIFHGASHFSTLMSLDLQDLKAWQTHWTVNVSAPVALTRSLMPMLKRSPHASVVFLTEDHAVAPRAYWGAFAASKGALTALTHMWQDEQMADSRVKFKLALPGPVASPLRAQSHPGEMARELKPVDALARDFLYLLDPASDDLAGGLYRCQ
jgi:NAD(P)-dependent dehydrogenase (short-subunit alcohol dehydrogenase family)